MILAGGAAFGVPGVPGLSADIDLDHDGLERFVLDHELHLASCVDGDGTAFEGRDCWAHPGFEDGISMTIHIEAMPARFAGRAPGWEERVAGTCDGGPPATSLFDPR